MAESGLDKLFASVRQQVRHLWRPLVGEFFADQQAVNVQRFLTGTGLAAICYVVCIVPPFIVRELWLWFVFAGILLVGQVGIVYWAWRPTLRTSKEVGRVLRAGGLQIDHDPGMQTSIIYQRWLTKNKLDVEEVIRILDSATADK